MTVPGVDDVDRVLVEHLRIDRVFDVGPQVVVGVLVPAPLLDHHSLGESELARLVVCGGYHRVNPPD